MTLTKKTILLIATLLTLCANGALATAAAAESPTTIELPKDSTIRSIVTQIIQHEDLRDRIFIDRVFGVHLDKTPVHFSTSNTPQENFDAKYTITTDGKDAYLYINKIATNECIKSIDFRKLYGDEVRILGDCCYHTDKNARTVVSSKVKNSIAYIKLNDMDLPCANKIEIGLFFVTKK